MILLRFLDIDLEYIIHSFMWRKCNRFDMKNSEVNIGNLELEYLISEKFLRDCGVNYQITNGIEVEKELYECIVN